MAENTPQTLTTPPEEKERRQKLCLSDLKALKALRKELKVIGKESCIITSDFLERHQIEVLDPLDLDDELGLGDQHPRFFAPIPISEARRAVRWYRRKYPGQWLKPCEYTPEDHLRRSDPPSCSFDLDAYRRCHYLVGLLLMLDFHPWKSTVRLHATARGVAEYFKVAHWHPDPKAFILKNSQGQQLLQARVDGYLSRKGTRDALVILETKPFVREAKRDDIERQEGAQMAAWIASDPRSKAPGVLRKASERDIRRVLISQDRHEIYVTIAEYGVDYVEYITDERVGGLPGRETPSHAVSPAG